ncbi:HEAT repeat domain-containing protein [Mycolicibacterium cosmeticum]|uniref:HEAT repeat domain-containing protein n=1 Tax=Mycolicibacterium cosmeticum TaxID=258533 RepID=UPI003204E9FF
MDKAAIPAVWAPATEKEVVSSSRTGDHRVVNEWLAARELSEQLIQAALDGGPEDWLEGARVLSRLSGHAWLVLDQALRWWQLADYVELVAAPAWLRARVDEPTGFVAAIASMHADGFRRERATRLLAANGSRIAGAALAVRLLDRVPQVRAQAWEAIRSTLGADRIELTLDILLAGRERPHAAEALRVAEEYMLSGEGAAELCRTLMDSDRRRVRRWAYTWGYELGLHSPQFLVEAARADSDQWVRGRCADWLGSLAPQQLTALLDAKSVDVRLTALARVRSADLTDEALARLLLDRAPRIRDVAQQLAAPRGFQLADLYRRTLADPATSPRLRAACLHGLSAVGDTQDVPSCTEYLRDPSPWVRSAAIGAVVHLAAAEVAVEQLATALRDDSTRVCLAAARGLQRLNAPASAAEDAWSSPHYASRRAAWRFARTTSGWNRVEADLRAAGDSDDRLAADAKAGLDHWVRFRAATTWAVLSGEQKDRIAHYLAELDLDPYLRRHLEFHAGVEPFAEPQPLSIVDPEWVHTLPSKRPRWFHVTRRRR